MIRTVRFIAIVLIGSSGASLMSRQDRPIPPLTAVESAVKDAYAREFGEPIERPAIYMNPFGADCKNGKPHLTTTAYFRTSPTTARLLFLLTSLDGRTVIRKSDAASVVIPAGTFRVLTVIVRHPVTVGSADLANWETAQGKINRDHATIARDLGLAHPIVSFENTNVLVDPVDLADARALSSVLDTAERQRFARRSYQFVVSINIDPARAEGGFAGRDGFIYMGNYSKWTRPLTAAEWINVANAVYHHEVGHHWGWPATHDWAPQCGRPPADRPSFIPPILFGWQDVDGDRIPEILDSTPYGRPK